MSFNNSYSYQMRARPEEMMDEREEAFDNEFIPMIMSSGLYEERILEVPLIIYNVRERARPPILPKEG